MYYLGVILPFTVQFLFGILNLLLNKNGYFMLYLGVIQTTLIFVLAQYIIHVLVVYYICVCKYM